MKKINTSVIWRTELKVFKSDSEMEFASLEQEAERKAATHVANMLHTPDKLEKVRIVLHITLSQP